MHYQKNAQMITHDVVSIEDRAFLYGDGCFSTACYNGREILLWDRHIQRLQHAIQALQLQCSIAQIEQDKRIFLQQLPAQQSGVIKVLLSRGQAARGYTAPKQAADIYFYFYPQHLNRDQPSVVDQVGSMPETLASSFSLLRGVKTLNRLEQVLLKTLATERGWDEALCFDSQQHLVEGIASNCFVYIDGIWHTPDLALAGIDGVMRQEILARMKHYQIAHQIGMISHAQIASIDAGFFCNSLHAMQIIRHLDTRALDDAPCQKLFNTLQLHNLA